MTDSSSPKPGITLFLMTGKGLAFLSTLAPRFGHLFTQVVVGRDAALQDDHADEIASACETFGIPWVKRTKLERIRTRYAMTVSWRWLIDHPAEQLIVFHDSPLPRYRGFAPLVNALVNGEREIGVTALFGAEEYDAGDILAQARSIITYPIRIQDAIEANLANYYRCAESVLELLDRGEPLAGVPQDPQAASFSVWRDEKDYHIDWRQSSAEIRRFIDAVGYPYHGAATTAGANRVRILAAEEYPDVVLELRHPGKILFMHEGCPIVICGTGLLRITDGTLESPEGGSRPLLPLARFRTRFGS